jgi:hypothetical protein
MNTRRTCTREAAGIASGAVAFAAAAHVASYGLWRGRCLTWGATAAEADACLPGDELLASPDVVTTRAVQIGAPPGLVWPWLAQMGPGRAGAYTYDWIENLLGLNMHSADVIIPEFQHIAVGDAWRLGARGPVLRVARLEVERALVVRSDDGNWVWAFALESVAGATRLVSRNRIATPGSAWPSRALARYLMEPGSLVMERKMLLGIKARAERLAAGCPAPAGTGQ